MNTFLKLLISLAVAATLSACQNPDHYPVSGQECGPDDPVQDVDASMADCVPNL